MLDRPRCDWQWSGRHECSSTQPNWSKPPHLLCAHLIDPCVLHSGSSANYPSIAGDLSTVRICLSNRNLSSRRPTNWAARRSSARNHRSGCYPRYALLPEFRMVAEGSPGHGPHPQTLSSRSVRQAPRPSAFTASALPSLLRPPVKQDQSPSPTGVRSPAAMCTYT